MLDFLKDESKWVITSAYKNLGPFISSLTNNGGFVNNDKLYDYYFSMIDSSL